MNIHELLMERICHAAAEVFSTMLGVELPAGEATVESGMPEVADGVVSLIGLAGAWVGTGSVACSPALACRVCSLMLMMETPAVNEDVLDAVAELTNMIIGSVKTDLESELGALGLSIPTVVFGRNFRTRSAGSTKWTVVRFSWEGDLLEVRIFLSPAEKTPANMLHGVGHHCTIDV